MMADGHVMTEINTVEMRATKNLPDENASFCEDIAPSEAFVSDDIDEGMQYEAASDTIDDLQEGDSASQQGEEILNVSGFLFVDKCEITFGEQSSPENNEEN